MRAKNLTSWRHCGDAATVLAALAVTLLLWGWGWARPSAAGAMAATLPPRSTPTPPTLPPRPSPDSPSPTPTITPVAPEPTPTPWPSPQPLKGGFIELRARLDAKTPGWQELWTAVEWQDAAGGWHVVEGWQGTFDEFSGDVGGKLWWVAEANFGEGPFRWVIYRARGGRPLVSSEPFRLPGATGESVRVEVTVVP